MLDWHISFSDSNEARETALAGEQVVVAIELRRRAYAIPDRKKVTALVVKQSHVDRVGECVRSFLKDIQFGERIGGSVLGPLVLGLDSIQPIPNLARNTVRSQAHVEQQPELGSFFPGQRAQ